MDRLKISVLICVSFLLSAISSCTKTYDFPQREIVFCYQNPGVFTVRGIYCPSLRADGYDPKRFVDDTVFVNQKVFNEIENFINNMNETGTDSTDFSIFIKTKNREMCVQCLDSLLFPKGKIKDKDWHAMFLLRAAAGAYSGFLWEDRYLDKLVKRYGPPEKYMNLPRLVNSGTILKIVVKIGTPPLRPREVAVTYKNFAYDHSSTGRCWDFQKVSYRDPDDTIFISSKQFDEIENGLRRYKVTADKNTQINLHLATDSLRFGTTVSDINHYIAQNNEPVLRMLYQVKSITGYYNGWPLDSLNKDPLIRRYGTPLKYKFHIPEEKVFYNIMLMEKKPKL